MAATTLYLRCDRGCLLVACFVAYLRFRGRGYLPGKNGKIAY